MEEIVEHQQGVDHHHHGIGKMAIVGGGVRERLDRPHHVVAPEADRAPGERRQTGDLERSIGAQQLGQVRERRFFSFPSHPRAIIQQPLDHATMVAIHRRRFGGQERVSCPALAALERFEQEAVRAPLQLGERGDRRVAIEHDLASQWNPGAPLPGGIAAPLEGVRHLGVASR